jgi:hypothetical protein
MDPIKLQIVNVAIKDLFTGDSFSICDVDNLLKVTGTRIPQTDYDQLRLLHCIKYAAMTPDIRDYVFTTVMQAIYYQNPDTKFVKEVGKLRQLRLIR